MKAVVTGASRGIGLAFSKSLSRAGYLVTMVARNEALLAQRTQELDRSSGQKHHQFAVDLARVTSPDYDTKKLAALFTDALLLVNCAGMTNHNLLARMRTEHIVSTLQLNLHVPTILLKMAILPMLRAHNKHGNTPQIINVSSMLSITGLTVPGTSVYAALKAGLLGLTESLANELGGKLRVNALLPALVPETDMGKTASPALPSVLLEAVVQAFDTMVQDQSMNGKFVTVDEHGPRTIN